MLVRSTCLLALDNFLAVIVESKLSNFTIGWVDWELDLLSVGLSLCHVLNVNAPSSAVNLANLALFTLGCSTSDSNSVTMANWKGTNFILFSKFFAQA